MKMEMTARDKKLLIGLAIFVIVVCIGYWGIRPVLKEMKQIDADIETETEQRDLNDLKMMELPMLQVENTELEENIVKAKKDFYPMMTSDEIDKYFTTMALSYNLQSYYLNISIGNEETKRGAYKYSQKYEDDLNAPVVEEDTSSLPGENTQDALDAVDAAALDVIPLVDTDSGMTGIYEAQISMRLGGDEATLKKLINDLSETKDKLMIQSYSWGSARQIEFAEDDSYDVKVSKILSITLNIYMCEE